ncbi:hypothetical protein J5N97_007068 [Dioscorea zingiberensis]|uniref:Uncharacterized protein n=1 Tax=Dioscorea zingiberensis TaxID=325984 RepID=A0A9D5HUP4_9LILI|nr:hypothetical protein J5N97_007068 [Dioscorea zingiberensis]
MEYGGEVTHASFSSSFLSPSLHRQPDNLYLSREIETKQRGEIGLGSGRISTLLDRFPAPPVAPESGVLFLR